ncbi:MAG: hypothetical protein PVH91_08035 [Pseudomonadales bacterium]
MELVHEPVSSDVVELGAAQKRREMAVFSVGRAIPGSSETNDELHTRQRKGG